MNALTAALAACNTAAAIEGTVAQYLRQWGASERQIKIYPNGLAKVQVLDHIIVAGTQSASMAELGLM